MILVNLPKYKLRFSETNFREFVLTYLTFRCESMINYLSKDDIIDYAFGVVPIIKPLDITSLEGFSWQIKDDNLTWSETIFILNIISLFTKVSITNTKFTLIRHRSFMKFLNFYRINLAYLYLENIDFKITNKSDLYNLNNQTEVQFLFINATWRLVHLNLLIIAIKETSICDPIEDFNDDIINDANFLFSQIRSSQTPKG